MWTFNPISRFPKPLQDYQWALRVLEDPRIVTSWGRGARFYDEPFQYQYTVATPDLGSSTSPERGAGGFGASFSAPIALMKAAGEAAERHSVSCSDPNTFSRGTFSQAAPELNPDHFRFFSTEQLRLDTFSRFEWTPDDCFHWVEGENCLNKRPVKLPAQLVYLNYKWEPWERQLVIPTSTGSASGHTIEDSMLGGILELMERDAFMIHYLQKIASVRIDLSSNSLFSEIEGYLARFDLELRTFVLETDLPVVTVMAVLLERSNSDVVSPKMSVGLKCSLSLERSMIGAIEESIQTRPWIRGLLQDAQLGNQDSIEQAINDCIIHRAMQWEEPELLKTASFFTDSQKSVSYSALDERVATRCASSLDELLQYCARADHPVYRVDVTIPAVREHGLVVSRILMPTLQQFYLEEPFIPLRCNRWRDVPAKLGLVDILNDEPNQAPHFFL